MDKQGNTIAGRKRNDEFDFYETPKWATEKAVEAMLTDGVLNKYEQIYEPCAGAGAITDILNVYGFENIKASDIQTADYIKGHKGVDVYDIEDDACEVVFTNPLAIAGNASVEIRMMKIVREIWENRKG